MQQGVRYVVVGGGSAGAIAASYLKKYWGPYASVTQVYDHKNPGIGVGESLTPIIYDYLNYVGISREDMIKNTNATVKLGLKFKNWLGDGRYFYHGFVPHQPSNPLYPLEAVYEVINNIPNGDTSYGSYMFETGRVPTRETATQSLHIDATLFSKYIEKKFSSLLNIIDGVVQKVNVDNDGIKSLLLQDGRVIEGDFFIDASGFQSVLIKELDNEWIDMQDWLPIDRCIPNPLPYTFDAQPVYTTSEASSEGWILQVPLSNRWGTGYLYSSNFLDEEKAFDNFNAFIKTNYKVPLNNTSKMLKFKSGYWNKQWVKNCICVGLSSGFAEPLEATNIHHTVLQLTKFVQHFTDKCNERSRTEYNSYMSNFYQNAYEYLRFCYVTRRTDSKFWQYMSENIPKEVKDIVELISRGIPSHHTLSGSIFNYNNFIRVGVGLGLIDRDAWRTEAIKRNLIASCHHAWVNLQKIKIQDELESIEHINLIHSILKSK